MLYTILLIYNAKKNCFFLPDEDQPGSEEEGEDLEEHWLDDYVAQPELDRYDTEDLDDGEYEMMTREQREAAERAMEEREARGDSGDRQAQADDMRDARFAGGCEFTSHMKQTRTSSNNL